MNDNIVYGEVTGNPLEALKQKMKIVLKKKELDKKLHAYLFVKNPEFARV